MSSVDLPSFATSSKIGHDFTIWSGFKIFALCAELAKLGKASQDAYIPGKWLILQAVLKNGVPKGVASDSHDTNLEHVRLNFLKDKKKIIL